ncbi:universal stress protein [Halosolutus amylolyticus]|uniref:Universal stress protein n=1 Tax=Halosolutus amylolyticus TaxID=2932267 RepID=A0ABD5PVG7_9EURY|nr:universal stress protein [Halosolutus amylolyticus]
MARHVLVPIDGSGQSWKAFEYALSNHEGSTITTLSVIHPAHGLFTDADDHGLFAPDDGGLFDSGAREQAEDAGEELREAARRRFEDADPVDTTLETVVEAGRPANTIVDYADEHDVDGIVIGSHGRDGASRVLLGSVAETVTRRAGVPVTIVR